MSAVKSCALAAQVSKCILASIHRIHFEFTALAPGAQRSFPVAAGGLRTGHTGALSFLSLPSPLNVFSCLALLAAPSLGDEAFVLLTSGLPFCIGYTERVVPWLTEGVHPSSRTAPSARASRRSSPRAAHGLLTCRAAVCACSACRVFRPRWRPHPAGKRPARRAPLFLAVWPLT